LQDLGLAIARNGEDLAALGQEVEHHQHQHQHDQHADDPDHEQPRDIERQRL
jgi:hypothetical protein